MEIDEENQPQNKLTELHFPADTTVNALLQLSSSGHQSSQSFSHHGYSAKDGEEHQPDDDSKSITVSLTIDLDAEDQLRNEDLVPVEQTLPSEGTMPRISNKSKKHSAKKMHRSELVDTTDSDSRQRKMRVRRHMKQESDDDF